MTWFQQSANAIEADKPHVALFIAVQIAFASGFTRFWTGFGTLNILGNDYTGAGHIGQIGVVPETLSMRAERKTYRLSGVDPMLVLESDIDSSFGRSVTEYFGFLTKDGALVAAPEVLWEGRIDAIRRVDGEEPIIELWAEHRLVNMDKSDNYRWTHEHQQAFFPGDTGFDQVAVVESTSILWGGSYVVTGGNLGGNPTFGGANDSPFHYKNR